MAIVSLLTSAAKLSLVTESAGRAKRCPRRPADAAADMTRLDEQLVQVQRARLIAGEPVEAQNNMGRRVGSRGKEMVTRGAPRPTALLPPSGLSRQSRSPKGLGHRIAASGPGIASACESAWGPGSSQFCSFHVEAGRRQAFLHLGPFDFLLNIR